MSVSCLECGYSVTEPICASCVTSEIEIWLSGRRIKKEILKEINNKFKLLLKEVDSLDYVLLPSKNIWKQSIMKCIRCRKEMHLMCFYCVSNQASRIVKDNLVDKWSIENFDESFNIKPYDYQLKEESSFMHNFV